MQITSTVHHLDINELKTYLYSALFIAGNIVFPQMCHLVPNGGLMLLPLYFFTLIAAYKYGMNTGLLTAVASPILNHLLFGMPAAGMLNVLLIKSVLLAVIAALVAKHIGKVTLYAVIAVVLISVCSGVIAEWMIKGSLMASLISVRMAIPGILLQIFGGWLLLRIWK